DMGELKANPNRQARGTVIESKLDKGRGAVATVLVQNGTLHIGDVLVAGTSVGRVRAMIDDKGKRVEEAGPSVPVEILGMSSVPDGGDLFYVVEDEKKARDVAEERVNKAKAEALASAQKASLDSLFSQIEEGKMKELNIIVKADVQGSVEAVKQSLEKISNEEVRVRVIHGGVGGVNESDIMLASASNAIIVGFNVRPDANAIASAERAEVEIRLYRIIYDAIEEIEAAMKGMLEPKFKEVVLGHAEIRQTFKVSGVGTIGGSYVTDGKISRNSQVRIVRDSIVIHEGVLDSLKRFKDDVKEVSSGYECGLGIENYNDIKEGDVIESFIMEEVKQ
ncbi:MAG: translation initiation factor IF-2, partial [Clostridia bacterium]|nr:translation initiation factor IF-2 [Clostridia bacterium]